MWPHNAIPRGQCPRAQWPSLHDALNLAKCVKKIKIQMRMSRQKAFRFLKWALFQQNPISMQLNPKDSILASNSSLLESGPKVDDFREIHLFQFGNLPSLEEPVSRNRDWLQLICEPHEVSLIEWAIWSSSFSNWISLSLTGPEISLISSLFCLERKTA